MEISEIIIKVRKKLIEEKVKKSSSILIAYSGGSDSSFLLDVLYRLKDELDLKLYCAYVNHNLREDSEIEEEFVTEKISKLKLPLFKKRIEKSFWDNLTGESIESGARKIRYNFFNEICRENNIEYIATAHNFNDKIETFFINVLRGSGTEALSSIPEINGKIIRPILNIMKEEINFYLEYFGINYYQDYTNSLDIYKRNIVRNKVIPILKEITPNIQKSFEAVFHHIEEDNDFLEKYSLKTFNEILKFNWKDVVGIDRNKYNELHPAIKSRILKKLFLDFGQIQNITFNLLKNLMEEKNKIKVVKSNFQIESCGKYIWFFIRNKYIKEIVINSINKDQIIIESPFEIAFTETRYDYYPVINANNLPITIRNIRIEDEIVIHKGKISIVKRLIEKNVPPELSYQGFVIINKNKEIISYFCGKFFELSLTESKNKNGDFIEIKIMF